jgi:hypothetical protein
MPDEPDHVTFTYDEKDYEFRRPEMGNVDEISFQRVNRNTRGGDLVVFRDDDWPRTEILNLNFVFVKEADGFKMMEFIKLSLGQLVLYTDHENRVWEGVIQNPDTELIQTGRSFWAVNLIFEGDQVE